MPTFGKQQVKTQNVTASSATLYTIKIMDKLIINIIQVGGIGCLVFTVFILFMAYSGIASEMRDEEGNFKKKRNLKTIFGAILFVSFLFGL